MEENIRIEICETNRGKKQIIINRKYKFNFSNEKKKKKKKNKILKKKKKKKKKIIQRNINALNIDLGLICPEYNSIRTQIIRSQNNQLPPDITTFEEIPEESEYYITKNGDNFIIFKNPNLIIFQSPFQAKPFLIYIMKNIFADGTFYIASKI